MNPVLRKEVLAETSLDTLRSLVLMADFAIEDLKTQNDALNTLNDDLAQTNIELRRELRNEDKDVRRYELLKHILPGMLEVAAYAGTRSDDAQEIFAGLDILKLDSMLDSQLAAGALEEIYDALDKQAEDALDAEAAQ